MLVTLAGLLSVDLSVRIAAGALVVAIGLLLLVRLRRQRRTPELEPAETEPADERPLAERTAPPPVEPAPPAAPGPEPEPGPEPVPGLEEPAPEQPRVPEAVRDLPRADELPEWFVRFRTGAPLEPGKRPRRR